MIYEFNFFHGAAVNDLIHKDVIRSIASYPTESNSSYVVDEKVGIYIKHSTKRLSPWRFSFKKEHQDEIAEMKDKLEEVFVLLVCNDDGIVCLDFDVLKKVLDDTHEEVEWISVARTKRSQYTIKGSDGSLRFKIKVSDYSKLKSLLQASESGL